MIYAADEKFRCFFLPFSGIGGTMVAKANIYLWDYSVSQIKAILARYNGTNEDATQYGNEVYEYYLIFKEYIGE